MNEIKCTQETMKKCKYASGFGGDSYMTCNYICVTGHKRPCPPDKCTVYEKGARIGTKPW